MSRVYVASSWRNDQQPDVVTALREAGHEVYDFKNPPRSTGFAWREVDLAVGGAAGNDPVNAGQFLAALEHPRAVEGFWSDFDAMQWADTLVLVLPCGRSAHLELGWAVGAGKRTAVLLDDPCTPELMYKMCDQLVTTVPDLLQWMDKPALIG